MHIYRNHYGQLVIELKWADFSANALQHIPRKRLRANLTDTILGASWKLIGGCNIEMKILKQSTSNPIKFIKATSTRNRKPFPTFHQLISSYRNRYTSRHSSNCSSCVTRKKATQFNYTWNRNRKFHWNPCVMAWMRTPRTAWVTGTR